MLRRFSLQFAFFFLSLILFLFSFSFLFIFISSRAMMDGFAMYPNNWVGNLRRISPYET